MDPIFQNTSIAAQIVAIYVVMASVLLRAPLPDGVSRTGFALLNVAAVWTLFFAPDWTRPWVPAWSALGTYGLYLLCGLAHFALLKNMENQRDGLPYHLALWLPIATLVVVKIENAWMLIGASYMAFRMALAAMEMGRNPRLRIGLADYFGFLFFLPTIPVGPISPFTLHASGLSDRYIAPATVLRGLARIAVGFAMYKFLAPIPQQLTFANLWTDGYTHGIVDFLISSYAYLLYLFLNFAGACHMAIGVAALIGIPVKENFNNPFFSRNIRDFWNRWHISLSEFVRDLIFTPVNIFLVRRLGPNLALPAAVVGALMTFLVIGLWHGSTIGFVYFGLAHGIGFSVNIVFEALTRKTRKRNPRLFHNPVWSALSQFMTITYVALTMLFVEFPTADGMTGILSVFSGGF